MLPEHSQAWSVLDQLIANQETPEKIISTKMDAEASINLTLKMTHNWINILKYY